MKDRSSRSIENNVLDFLEQTVEEYGNLSASRFSDEIKCHLYESGISSPIEDIFYIALAYRCHEIEYQLNPFPDYDKKKDEVIYPDGIYAHPQRKIGKYRVDFLIQYQSGDILNEIIVELDGHDFHDKNKKQRAYEKARDRYLVQQGYKVFHYTGSEVVADPFGISKEVLDEITKRSVTHSYGSFE